MVDLLSTPRQREYSQNRGFGKYRTNLSRGRSDEGDSASDGRHGLTARVRGVADHGRAGIRALTGGGAGGNDKGVGDGNHGDREQYKDCFFSTLFPNNTYVWVTGMVSLRRTMSHDFVGVGRAVPSAFKSTFTRLKSHQ